MKKLWFVLAALLLTVVAAPAQDFPQRPIHFIVAFGPGGGSDIIARILADAMQTKLGQAIVVENKPGAGGILGNDIVARAAPDGYTLGVMTAGQIIAAVTTKKMPYDTNTAFAPGGPDRDRQPVDRDAAGFPGQQRQGADRVRQGQSRQGRVRESRLCRHPAFCRRAVQAKRQDRPAARAVPHHAGIPQRGARPPRRHHVRHGVGA